MKSSLSFIFAIIALFTFAVSASAQADTVVSQITNSSFESFAASVSGDGRFVVFESKGNIATENPRNADGNTEIFLFDYAQRRIFQITDTKSVLFDTTKTATASNTRVDIVNRRPVISNDGRWIVFSSNATSSTPTTPDSSNPGGFDANALSAPTPTPTPTPMPTATPSPSPSPTPTVSPTPTPTPAANPLTTDGNLEVWLYQIPDYAPADLTTGDEIALTDLAGGTFTMVTNTLPSQLPRAGSATLSPSVADDNHDATIDDDGGVIAFVSTRPLTNTESANNNDEIFTYVRSLARTNQITKTDRGSIGNPIYSKYPSISGLGNRIIFASTGDNPILNMTGGSNGVGSINEEIFLADLDPSTGDLNGTKKQLTVTTPTPAGAPVNILDPGKRLSRDGRYVAFSSFADLANENGGTNFSSFALYLYDLANISSPVIRRVGPRSDADTAATGGDVAHYPGFTDNDGAGTPSTLLFQTRQNIKADGTVPATATDGLNPTTGRPPQIYSYPLNIAPAGATFTRVTKFPAPGLLLALTQPLTSDSSERFAFNLAISELGTGNPDGLSEVYYLLNPRVTGAGTANVSFLTGASGLPVTPSPTVSPTPTPTPTPSPSPSPTTPAAVLGVSPGSMVVANFDVPLTPAVTPRTGVGSIQRVPNLPIELSGISMSINGVSCGLKSVDSSQIAFVAPPFLSSSTAGTIYDVVINNNGTVYKTKITIVPAQPDIFNRAGTLTPGGRAFVTNVTNRVATFEPFMQTTIQTSGGTRTSVDTILRVYLTGVANTAASTITVRIGSLTIPSTRITTGGVISQPGVYTIDFTLPPEAKALGDQPIIVTVTANGAAFSSRLDDTAARLRIL